MGNDRLVKETRKPSNEQMVRGELRSEVPAFLRDAVLVGLVLFVLCGGSVLLVYLSAASNETVKERGLLQQQAEYAASLVDAREHAALKSASQTGTAGYRAQSDKLQHTRRYFPEISELFTGRLEGGAVRVILDTHNPDRSVMPRHTVARPLDPALAADGPELKAIKERKITVFERPVLSGGGEGSFGVIVPIGDGNFGTNDFLYLGSADAIFSTNLPAIQTAMMLSLAAAAIMSVLAAWATFMLRYRSRFRQELAVLRLRESEELFRTTYALSPVAMFLTTTEGRLLRANQAFSEFIGIPEYELLRMKMEDFSDPDDFAQEQTLLRSLRHHQTTKYEIEKRYRRRGGPMAIGLTGVAVVRDSDGVSSHFMVQVVDITSRKQGEETLRISQDRLALAADAGGVGVWDCTLPSGVMVWNDVMHQVYQTDPRTFTPTLEQQLARVHPDDRKAVDELFRQSATDGTMYQSEHRILVDGGKRRHVRVRAMITRDAQNRPVRAVGTTIDITDEKEEAKELLRAKEAALAADKAKSEFLAVMSHEIRTPLNGVLGFASMLKLTPLNDEQQGYIETMESSGQRLLALVNDILDLSKIESGEVTLDRSLYDLRPFVQTIHRQLEAKAWEKKLRYEIVYAEGTPEQIYTDPARLGQVLTNLLGNAVKFTESGSVELHVSAKCSDSNIGRWDWVFSVKDTGPGIPPESAAHLSKLFYQVDSSSTRKHDGSGMGLAISCRLAGLLGGQIQVRSKQGVGSEFTLEFVSNVPRDVAPAAPKPMPPKVADATRERVRGKRVLVVEDNPVNRKLCALQLRRLGCETDFAETGREAVEKTAGAHFDAVLMDMHLPDLDGCDATREIRRRETNGVRLNIIALTANAMAEDRKKCFDAGMDDFLSKPIQFETLATTLAKWV
jgi:PAS domain S-box-containing protein